MATPGKLSNRRVLLTGAPGVGKTTLVEKICTLLKVKHDVLTRGFYTEELRVEGKRIGFDIVTLNGHRGILARLTDRKEVISHCKVGQYSVSRESFESIALPVFKSDGRSILVLDEIGKMELFSNLFKEAVLKAFSDSTQAILATIPISKGRPLPLVESLKSQPNCMVYTVDRSNRDSLATEIVDTLLDHGSSY